jgi:hypothetical protein
MYPIHEAALQYGVKNLPIPAEDLHPIQAFNPDDHETCAFNGMAVLSNLSGGHKLMGGVLVINREFQYARIIGNGFTIRWGTAPRRELDESIETFIARMDKVRSHEQRIVLPFDVSSDQYGDGWRRAIKHPATHGDFLEERGLKTAIAPGA